jgi:hypothetical protein
MGVTMTMGAGEKFGWPWWVINFRENQPCFWFMFSSSSNDNKDNDYKENNNSNKENV